MTTFEHAMLAANGVVAAGLHQRFGWKVVALSAVAAIVPDWDGLTVLIDASVFDRGHRVWGHNIFACCLTGATLGLIDYRFDLIGRFAQWLAAFKPLEGLRRFVKLRTQRSWNGALVWVSAATLAALSQIPADAVVSGGQGLSDWPVKVLWPISDLEVVYPLVPWGDPGITVVFAAGMILGARFPSRLRLTATCTLGAVAGYILLRGFVLP